MLDVAAVDEAIANPEVIAIVQSVSHLGKYDTDLLGRMRDHGPGYLHAAVSWESNVVY